MQNLVSHVSRYASRWWYEPLMALLSAVDAFIPFVPNEPLLAAGVIAKRGRWLRLGLMMASGSALGALALAAVVSHWSGWILGHLLSAKLLRSKGWRESVRTINRHGWWGLALISLGPFPQHAAVIFVGLLGMPLTHVFGAVFAGRAAKYVILAWLVARVKNPSRR